MGSSGSGPARQRLVTLAAIVLAACPVLSVFFEITARDPFSAHGPIYATYYVGAIVFVFFGVAARVAGRGSGLPNSPVTPTRILGLKVSWFFLVVIAWMVTATLLLAPDKATGIFMIGELCLAVAVGIAAADLSRASGPVGMARLWWLLCMSVTITAVAAVIIHVSDPESYGDRGMPVYIHIRVFGFSLTASIAILTAFLAQGYADGRRRFPNLVLLTILWAILFWTASRGGIVALVLAMAFGASFIAPLRRVVLPWTAALCAGMVLSLAIPGQGHSGTVTLLDDTLGLGRWAIWTNVLELIAERPMTGYGYAQYQALMEAHNPRLVQYSHTHNIILESLLAVGVLGTLALAYVAITGWVGWLLELRKKPNLERMAAFLVVSVLYAYSLVDAVYFFLQATLFFAVASGILSARQQREIPDARGTT